MSDETRTEDICLGCAEKKKIVSRGLCDACRKRAARDNVEQTAKRHVRDERAELRRLVEAYRRFQDAYLELGLSPRQTATELAGLLKRCAEQFAPVVHLLNPAATSGSGHAAKMSTSTLSTQPATAPNVASQEVRQ